MFSFFSGKVSGSDLNPQTFSEKLKEDKNGILLDVRTPAEYRRGHMPCSTNIDIHDTEFKKKIEELDKSRNYYVYCRSGSRSANVLEYMKSVGFTNVFNLEGGILNWKETLEK